MSAQTSKDIAEMARVLRLPAACWPASGRFADDVAAALERLDGELREVLETIIDWRDFRDLRAELTAAKEMLATESKAREGREALLREVEILQHDYVMTCKEHEAMGKAGDALAHQLMYRDYGPFLDAWWKARGGHEACTVCRDPVEAAPTPESV